MREKRLIAMMTATLYGKPGTETLQAALDAACWCYENAPKKDDQWSNDPDSPPVTWIRADAAWDRELATTTSEEEQAA